MQMPDARRADVLYYIVCAGPPAAEAHVFVRLAQAAGWDVCIIVTPQATKFVDAPRLQRMARYPIRSDYKLPHEEDVLPQANALVVAPLTFNTMNKWAHGIADTLPVSLLSEYLGLNVPIIAAPNINPALARHPVVQRSLAQLREWSVRVLMNPSMPPPTWMVDWKGIIAELGSAPTR